jgi:hypothetical protein
MRWVEGEADASGSPIIQWHDLPKYRIQCGAEPGPNSPFNGHKCHLQNERPCLPNKISVRYGVSANWLPFMILVDLIFAQSFEIEDFGFNQRNGELWEGG